jgi:amiloride-sensitive sodium channel
MKKCNCSFHNAPSKSTISESISRNHQNSAGGPSTKICSFLDYDCQAELEFSFGTEVDRNQQLINDCECLPSCNSITYEQNVVTSRLETTQEASDKVTVAVEQFMLRFYFGSDEYTALRRYGSYDTVTFLSDCGGILGLFLGVSSLTVVEVFYFFVMRITSNLVRKMRNGSKVSPVSSSEVAMRIEDL